MTLWILIVSLICFDMLYSRAKVAQVARSAVYRKNCQKYFRARKERMEHEELNGVDNAIAHFRLQELIRIEVGALEFLRNYHPRESAYLEIDLRALLRRMDDTVIH
ncbi:MAG: hypothetical protein A3C79_01575 [Candidatus Taylorbacteria bacterium RIFCSPHIGHO2_02_FULL_45_28]|uniref:Uncharacterized protein n=1 Tax=Candidatus Taylorbacteria bacterium RIFCSPHIGHO2_12_FULL_45_16 TaxID=1802315 RepID=A0A1G2MYJ5_9BACT|nr:MAG: hypothetical protein A2830_03740 [Candidatus Taylorbacteria bacterium RIFCSPHIGHO2_01_FULL_44_110]OHA25126.1 MAG: hypothetical protein A3C79_01575 [Candidatus Taylorbacteria bacterium RIFCSPHIGHO2_02_FULL_45_28]OHA29006.1 MAG: hypothetical protein A3F51_01955 [Candidatus Taylorbacteria bacterium RIFCSPHIGHO2_12_FULL_45_16]OHA33124.1 MAG: hypothetical protein A3A23_03635 [Candidatus Taylorbacteria bacterium RIFCSPLOWO2_01_FULL_45_59]OHA39388.1 MAG: hypothetical protein A3I98_02295 [Candi